MRYTQYVLKAATGFTVGMLISMVMSLSIPRAILLSITVSALLALTTKGKRKLIAKRNKRWRV